MYDIAPEVISIAEACLGGLQGRSALLIGPEEQIYPFTNLLERAKMKRIYQEDTLAQVVYLLPLVHLVISMPSNTSGQPRPYLTAGRIAQGCEGRHTPLLIMDIVPTGSVEELAGLLPSVCLYTPDDLRLVLRKTEMKAS